MCVSTWWERKGGATARSAGEASLVQDVLWAHALPWHGLQHVRVAAEGDGLTVHLFFLTQDPTAAEARAASLVRRASGSPLLPDFNEVSR
ncbi:hypothetical protein KUM39_26290 [Streptomyces sp. J2-1]|uniref:hypothetical protein n=1 Tax=Streptomyces corallincola TaxID=2851888 RepID=UPI001C3803E5|nr:hypothetical protein [Streptomyces corallincola]MBV2357824.1 hypothetical protein [Streptomyces corallincola]